MMRLAVLFLLLGLAGCGNMEPPAACKGPVFSLNTGRWQPTAADLNVLGMGKSK
jgi:type IV secretion system protein VirB7